MHKIGISLLLAVLIISGCASNSVVCPKYPKPTQQVLVKIKSLNDKDVDDWIVKQFKLNKQLKICND